jgi:hypothetical protein
MSVSACTVHRTFNDFLWLSTSNCLRNVTLDGCGQACTTAFAYRSQTEFPFEFFAVHNFLIFARETSRQAFKKAAHNFTAIKLCFSARCIMQT